MAQDFIAYRILDSSCPRTRKETVLRNQEAQELCQGIPGPWNTNDSVAPSPTCIRPALCRTARARQTRFLPGSQVQLSPHLLWFIS